MFHETDNTCFNTAFGRAHAQLTPVLTPCFLRVFLRCAASLSSLTSHVRQQVGMITKDVCGRPMTVPAPKKAQEPTKKPTGEPKKTVKVMQSFLLFRGLPRSGWALCTTTRLQISGCGGAAFALMFPSGQPISAAIERCYALVEAKCQTDRARRPRRRLRCVPWRCSTTPNEEKKKRNKKEVVLTPLLTPFPGAPGGVFNTFF